MRQHYGIYEFDKFRSEPNQWIHAFENMSITIYVFSLIPSSLWSYNDEPAHHIQRELAHLSIICISKSFSNTPILLLIHNVHQINGNFQSSIIEEYFPDYGGDLTDIAAVKTQIRELFFNLGKNSGAEIRIEYNNDQVNAKLGKWTIGIIDDIFTRASLLAFGT